MKYSDYIAYFKTAAVNNKVLAHVENTHHTFYEIDMEDLINGLKMKNKFMSMFVESPETRVYDEKSDNLRKIRIGAFAIMQEAKIGDRASRENVLDDTEEVAEQIVSKMLNDTRGSRRKNYTPRFNLDIASVRFFKVGPILTNLYGWRVEFTLNDPIKNNLMLDESKWNNETLFNPMD